MPKNYETQQANVRTAKITLDQLKLSVGCIDCGYREHPAALHFDHVNPRDKRRDTGWFDCRSKLHSKVRLLRYLDHVQRYCVIRCANCHARRTSQEQHWKVRRGEMPAIDPTLF